MSLILKLAIILWIVDAFLFFFRRSQYVSYKLEVKTEFLQWLMHMAACILSIAAVIGF